MAISATAAAKRAAGEFMSRFGLARQPVPPAGAAGQESAGAVAWATGTDAPDPSEWFTTDEACLRLGVAAGRLYYLVKTGRLTPRRYGRRNYWSRQDLDAVDSEEIKL